MSCQDRLSSWKQEVSTAFAHLSQAQVVGLVRLPRRHRLDREQRDRSNQGSPGSGVGAEREKRVPTAARVVSGCRPQAWGSAP